MNTLPRNAVFNSVSRRLLTRETRLLYEQGRSTDDIARRLREYGANQLESIIVLRDATCATWETARRDVYFSMAWFNERCAGNSLWHLREEDYGPPQAVIWDSP